MASSMALIKLAYVVLACMVVGAPLAQAAITCGLVASKMAPCFNYLRLGGIVPVPCCNGVRSLNAAAATTPDRQQACKCLKSTAASLSGFNYGYANSLAAKCGVNIPYKITPTINCNSIK